MENMRLLAIMTVICGVVLMSIPAFASHCPGEFGSRCCYRQSPPPNTPNTPGGYNVCDWPDDCHIRCYEEYNRVDELTQPVDYRAENYFPGSCQAFVDRIINIGILAPTKDGGTKYKRCWGGYTWHKKFKWNFDPGYSQQVEQSSNGVNVCLTLTSLKGAFSWEMTQDVLRWEPSARITGLSEACAGTYKRYVEATIAHENAHAAVAQSIADFFNDPANQPVFTITACAPGRTQGEAFSAAHTKLKAAIDANLRAFQEREIEPKRKEDDRTVHKNYIVPLPDCSLCDPDYVVAPPSKRCPEEEEEHN